MTTGLGGISGRRVLLVIAGGIAAYKCLDLIRRLRDRGVEVRVILTAAGARFVTPLSVAALSGNRVFEDLFSLTDEAEMGHIRLARDCDLVVVAPATADLMAKMAHGLADDLASTALLATDCPILLAPAMNAHMWSHPATRANLAVLESRGVSRVGPNAGDLACGETGAGRMAEPLEILQAVARLLAAPVRQDGALPLAGRRILVTSGPTREALDPVRYISNHSSGRQGHAIAAALARQGAEVTLVSGPVQEPDPPGVTVVRVESARDMLAACQAALPVAVAVCAAAVADWRVAGVADQKLKKGPGGPPVLALMENPDILATLSRPGPTRPALVVGFAAETENLLDHARAKLIRKGCDWILANDVGPGTGTFGGSHNTVFLLRRGDGDGAAAAAWPPLTKEAVAQRLAVAIADALPALAHGAP